MKEERSSPNQSCPKCGATIPVNAPRGLCPKCLLEAVAAPTAFGASAAPPTQPPPLEAVQAAFPQLEVRELIGQGGMGFVFKARQPHLDRWVALKLMPDSRSAQPTFTERFAQEGRLLARLTHPNIVSVYDFGQANGFFFLLMEYVDGVNLRQAMRAGRFTPAQALAIVPAVCEALQYAHEEGVLHRDIKPENILLDTKGRIKIADFGVAKILAERGAESLTASGAALGTPHYMAPEQIENPAEVDHRADIFSLGVVLYELLTGELPLGRFEPPSSKTPLNPQVDEIVLRALEKERARRQQSAGELKTQIETASAHGPNQPANSGPGVSAEPQPPVLRSEVILLFGLLAALIFGAAKLVGYARPMPLPLFEEWWYALPPSMARLIGYSSLLLLVLWVIPVRWVWRCRTQFLAPFGISPPGPTGNGQGSNLSLNRALYSVGSLCLLCWTFLSAIILSTALILSLDSMSWSMRKFGELGAVSVLLPLAFPAVVAVAFFRRNRAFSPTNLKPLPNWARRAGALFLITASFPLMWSWILGGNRIWSVDTWVLVAGTGIALLSGNRTWRRAALALNWSVLFLSLYGFGERLVFVFGTSFYAVDVDWKPTTLDSFSLLFSGAAYSTLFIAALWALNHRDVLPVFGLRKGESARSES